MVPELPPWNGLDIHKSGQAGHRVRKLGAPRGSESFSACNVNRGCSVGNSPGGQRILELTGNSDMPDEVASSRAQQSKTWEQCCHSLVVPNGPTTLLEEGIGWPAWWL